MMLSVLLADSSDSVKKALELGLKDYKTDVTRVTSNVLEEAIRLKPQIAFIDVLLEHEDGYIVCEKLKSEKSLKNTKVVIMTSSFLRLDEERFLQAKADANLKKPFDIKSLKETINKLFKSNEESSQEISPLRTSSVNKTQNIDDFSNVPLSRIKNLKPLNNSDFSFDKSYKFEDNNSDIQTPPAPPGGLKQPYESSLDLEGVFEDINLSRNEQVEILENTTRDMVRKLLPNIVTRYVKEELRKLMSKTDE